MATITDVVRTRNFSGLRAERVLQMTGPASYTTGGDSVTAAQLYLGEVEWCKPNIALDANGANPRMVIYNYTTNKFLWFVPNTGSEVANATDLSGYVTRVYAVGRG